jgi:hypothetical protein
LLCAARQESCQFLAGQSADEGNIELILEQGGSLSYLSDWGEWRRPARTDYGAGLLSLG